MPSDRRPHSRALSAYWVPLNVQASALLASVVPSTLLRLAPNGRTAQLARLAALASLLSMVVPPVVGPVSDRLRRRWVGRTPFVVAGSAINIAASGGRWAGRRPRHLPPGSSWRCSVRASWAPRIRL